MECAALLEDARQARRDGDLSRCIERARAAAEEAEAVHDAETAYHALACVGRLHYSRDEPEQAAEWCGKARDAARSGGLVRWLAGSYHDLFLCMRESGNRAGARRYAGTAHDLYADFAPRHPYVSALTADMAQCDFEFNPTADNAQHALQAWRACPVSIPDEPRVQLIAIVNALHATSVAELPRSFARAAERLTDALGRLTDREGAAKCLVTASEAFRRMRQYPRAHVLALCAESIATERGEDVVRQKATHAKTEALAERAP